MLGFLRARNDLWVAGLEWRVGGQGGIENNREGLKAGPLHDGGGEPLEA